MAGYPVVRTCLSEMDFSRTKVIGYGTSSSEPTSLGNVSRAGDLSFQYDSISLHVWIRNRNGRQESLCVRVKGMAKEFVSLSNLDDRSQIHYGHPI